jgi:hypothetical protein
MYETSIPKTMKTDKEKMGMLGAVRSAQRVEDITRKLLEALQCVAGRWAHQIMI